jgi:translation initiation factor 1
MLFADMSRDLNSRLVYSTDASVQPEAAARATRPAADRPPGASKANGLPGVPKANGNQIRIRLDRRASDRVVTVVTGLPGSLAEKTALARLLKSACGTGGTVKDGALELQGDHRDSVEAALGKRGLQSKRSGG